MARGTRYTMRATQPMQSTNAAREKACNPTMIKVNLLYVLGGQRRSVASLAVALRAVPPPPPLVVVAPVVSPLLPPLVSPLLPLLPPLVSPLLPLLPL